LTLPPPSRRARPNGAAICLFRYAAFVSASTVLLIAAGGMVTSTGSGLAVPDWPTTYGYSMFTFPLSKMVGGIFYEHGHRLIASGVGVLTIGLALWVWRREERRWVKRLAAAALAAVIVQGLLGGLTVYLLLPPPVSVAHAALAQLFFCMTVSLAVVLSPGWPRRAAPAGDDRIVDARFRRLALATTVMIYLQIIAGAVMRHTGAGLAIPDFPLAFGRLLPPDWGWPVVIHFAHRIGAVLVAFAILATGARAWRSRRRHADLVAPATLLALLVAVQIALGGWTVLSGREPRVNTAHVVTGALVLATSLVLSLRAHRGLFAAGAAAVPAGRARSAAMPRSSEARA
jgi:cytochrome c oxidase assembly protein subunit 15